MNIEKPTTKLNEDLHYHSKETGVNLVAQSEAKKMWEELDSLKTRLSTLSKSVELLLWANRNSENEEEKEKKLFDERFNHLRLTYDRKLTVFLSSISIDCEDKISKIKKDSQSQNLRTSKDITKIESRFQKKIE